MLSNPTIAEGGPVDVYSLAKTLWVLATGQRFPFPGEQRFDVSQLGVRSFQGESTKTIILDRLIERATRHDPSTRPSMTEFEEELLTLFAEKTKVAIEPIDKVARTLSAALMPKIQRGKKISALIKAGSPLIQQLDQHIKTAENNIKKLLESEYGKLSSSGVVSTNSLRRLPDQLTNKKYVQSNIIREQNNGLFLCVDQKRLFMCYISRIYENAQIEVIAVIFNRTNKDEILWENAIVSTVGTANSIEKARILFNEMFAQMPAFVEKIFR